MLVISPSYFDCYNVPKWCHDPMTTQRLFMALRGLVTCCLTQCMKLSVGPFNQLQHIKNMYFKGLDILYYYYITNRTEFIRRMNFIFTIWNPLSIKTTMKFTIMKDIYFLFIFQAYNLEINILWTVK